MIKPDLLEYKYLGLNKIISGGQIGADQGALFAAKDLKLKTGGYAPKGYKTSLGNDLTLKDFGLIEHSSSSYSPRTKLNVKCSDATLLVVSNRESPGSKLTISSCCTFKKPFLIIYTNFNYDDLNNFMRFILKNRVSILNVAGNRDRANSHHPTVHFDSSYKIITWLITNLDKCNLINREILE